MRKHCHMGLDRYSGKTLSEKTWCRNDDMKTFYSFYQITPRGRSAYGFPIKLYGRSCLVNHQVPDSRLYAPSGLWGQLTGAPKEHHTTCGFQFRFITCHWSIRYVC